MNAPLESNETREKYGALLSAQLPRVIRNKEENDHWLKVIAPFFRKEHLHPEEEEFVNLLAVLIEDFEHQTFPVEAVDPIEAVQGLIDENNLRHRDLLDVFKTESIVSEVLNRKRPLTKEHVERLVKRFNVSADLFSPKAAHAGSSSWY